ncbi:MAG: VanW family protein [Microgenomates group bacterium GW2011_GWA1_46_7]|nr:MAG: VanW family protein [Microgenomates group bacterium GW2011_GWA1_46_7]
MKKKRKPEKLGVVRVGSFFVLGVVSGVMGLICVARLTWHSKFYPGVTVAGVEIAGMNRELAKLKLTEIKEAVKFEIEASLNEAYRYGRRFQIGDYLLLLINKKTNFPLVMAEGKTESREKYVFQIAEAIEIPPIEPTIEMVENKIRVINGSDGIVLDEVELERRIRERYSQLGTEVIEIPTKIAERQLSTEKLDQLKARAEILVKKKLQLTLDDERIQLEGAELIHFLDTTGSGEEIDRKVIGEYVLGLGDSLNRVPQDAKFEFVEGKVKEFAPGKEGVEVKTQETSTSVTIAVRKLLLEESKEEIVEIAVVRTPPKITTDKVNELGIRERIGRGESYYAHSIANRIYNVGLASSRANSTLIPPGEEFSFNRAVGEITGASGAGKSMKKAMPKFLLSLLKN